MAAQPSEQLILQFIEWSGGVADHKTAIDFLKASGNEFQAAISEYFDNPNKHKHQQITYNENEFAQDRYGDATHHDGIPSFQIDCSSENGQYPHSTAPTRPPSRVSFHGLPNTNTPSATLGSQQESGVIDGSGVRFGPANKPDYPSSQWSMVPLTATNEQEIISDVDVADRRRNDDEPAFLKPLPDGDYLPSLITILNTIPVGRQALLFPPHDVSNYGYDTQWWTGALIRVSETVDLQDERPRPDHVVEVIEEAQRLSAFLDRTERSYGSAEALANLRALDDVHTTGLASKTTVDKFLVAWEAGAQKLAPGHTEQIERIFHSVASRKSPGEREERTNFWCLELSPSNDHSTSSARSLYDAMDETIWCSDPDGTEPDQFSIVQVADILIIRVLQSDTSSPGLNMHIPSSLYVDRYLSQNMAAAKAMRKDIADCKAKIAQLEEKQKMLHRVPHPKFGESADAMNMLETAIAALKKRPDMRNPGLIREDSPAPGLRVAQQLQEVYNNIKLRLQTLEDQKERIRQTIEELSNLLKEPSDSGAPQPQQLYKLRGVATDSHTTYFLHGKGAAATDHATQMQNCLQWWMTKYDIKPEITKRKLTEDEVIKAAETEGKEVLLIYASTRALTPQDEDEDEYPPALKAFVQRDNDAFRAEEEHALRSEPVMELPTWDDQRPYNPPPDGRWTPDRGLTASDDSAVDVRSDGRREIADDAAMQDPDVEGENGVMADSFEPERV